jgi:hypothetical protein
MDWLQIGATLGVSTVFLIGIGIFVSKQVWPFVVKRIEINDARVEAQNQALIKALTDHAAAQARTLMVLEEMKKDIQAIRQQPQARQRGSSQ